MTSIVGKKMGAVGSGELFSFVVLTICVWVKFILCQGFLKNYFTYIHEILYTWQVLLVVLWKRK